MHRFLLTLAVLLTLAGPASAQVWTEVSTARVPVRTDLGDYRLVRLDADALDAALATADAVAMPLPDGGVVDVRLAESSVMAPALQARYPSIRTYTASSARYSGRVSWTEHGFKGVLFNSGEPVVIDPYDASGGDLYVVHRLGDLIVPDEILADFQNEVLLTPPVAEIGTQGRVRSSGETLRTYRLAVSARAEYVQQNGGTVASGLAAIVGATNRLNAIYERDLAIRFELVSDNDKIIYLDPNTDPFTGRGSDDGSPPLAQNQTSIDATIGSDNYDIGHMIGFNEGGGVARLGAACVDGAKAVGLSGIGTETSLFDLVVFPHEIGHMLNAPHAWVQFEVDGVFETNGVEPLMGYTIMSYGQFANGGGGRISRPASERIGLYFHGYSLRVMNRYVRVDTGATCGTDSATGNDAPVVTVPDDRVVAPVGTAFELAGTATDNSGTELTYAWEQINRHFGGTGSVPVFRSLPLSTTPTRTFPSLSRALAGEPYPDETLPTVAGTYSFQLTVRDNVAGAGGVGLKDLQVRFVETGAPFAVTSQDIPTVVRPGSVLPVTWTVGGTDQSPVSTSTVEVFVVTDGGSTRVSLGQTANDGAVEVQLPDGDLTDAYIMVKAVGNVFYALSEAPFRTGIAPVAALPLDPIQRRLDPGSTESPSLLLANESQGGEPLIYQSRIRSATVVSQSDAPWGFWQTDSDDPQGPTGDFVDVSDTATALTFEGVDGGQATDDGHAIVDLPFDFPFYGTDVSQIAVSINGLLRMDARTTTDFENQTLPSDDQANGLIAPFWDDLKLGAGAVYTATLDDGRFLVQYQDVAELDGSGTYSFEVILSPDGAVEIVYGAMNGDVRNATIGVESLDATSAVALAVDEPFARSARAVRLDASREWVRLGAPAGDIVSGESTDLGVVLDAQGMPDGDYTAELVVETNDGDRSQLIVPVLLRVGGNPISNDDAPLAAQVSLVSPNPAGARASLRLTLPQPQTVRATVVDALGREVAVLHDGQASGTLSLGIESGRLATGVYVVRVVGADWVESRQMVVAR